MSKNKIDIEALVNKLKVDKENAIIKRQKLKMEKKERLRLERRIRAAEKKKTIENLTSEQERSVGLSEIEKISKLIPEKNTTHTIPDNLQNVETDKIDAAKNSSKGQKSKTTPANINISKGKSSGKKVVKKNKNK